MAGEDPPGPRVLAYLLGARRWLELESWPPPDARPLALEVCRRGLVPRPARMRCPRVRGGRRLQGGVPGGGFGPRDQRPLLEGGQRAAPRLQRAASRASPPPGPQRRRSRSRRAASDPRQWVAILCREEADGALVNLAEGVAVAPADAGEITIELGDLCIELAAGARLALLVTGGLARRFPAPASRSEQRVDGAELVLTVI